MDATVVTAGKLRANVPIVAKAKYCAAGWKLFANFDFIRVANVATNLRKVRYNLAMLRYTLRNLVTT